MKLSVSLSELTFKTVSLSVMIIAHILRLEFEFSCANFKSDFTQPWLPSRDLVGNVKVVLRTVMLKISTNSQGLLIWSVKDASL